MFQGVEKGCIGNKWVNTRSDYYFWEYSLLYFVIACFAVDNISSEMLDLVTGSPSIARLQVMIFAKDVGNKAKGRISKRVFQESKTCQNFRKTNI